MPSPSVTPAGLTPANHYNSQGTQTLAEDRPSLPPDTTPPGALRRTPGSHPLQSYRTSTDKVTGTTTPQAMQDIHAIHTEKPSDHTRDVGLQTMHHDNVRDQSLANVRNLFKSIENQISVGLGQDIALSREIALAGQMPAPRNAHASDCVCLPPDLMAYRVPTEGGGYKLRYNCPEINGTGFGGIRDIHPEQLQEVMRTYAAAGKEIALDAHNKNEVPLIIVANSGREGAARTNGAYNKDNNSKMIWEKMYIADTLAEALASDAHDVFADSLDKHVTQYYKELDALGPNPSPAAQAKVYDAAVARMAKHKDEPMVLLGYSRDLAACCKVENGRPVLFGRPVHGAVNDRGLQNLALTEGKPLDYRTFSPMNASVQEGVDKFAAAESRAAFLASDAFKKLPEIAAERGFKFDPLGVDQIHHFPAGAKEAPEVATMSPSEQYERRTTYFRGIQEHEGEDGVIAAFKDFAALGLRPMLKPNGTGQSLGIIAPKTGESVETFVANFKKNLAELEAKFGKGAGYPFMTMPLLKLDETPDNEAYDLRFATFQNTDVKGEAKIRSVPLILKKEPPKEKAAADDVLEFSPTNVTASVAKTGKQAIDFIVPLCSEKGMQASGLNVDNLKSISLYFAAHEAWMLENAYPRPDSIGRHHPEALVPAGAGAA